MKLKIHNSEVISFRVSGDLYYVIMQRAEAKAIPVSEYVKNAVIKYMEYKNGAKPIK